MPPVVRATELEDGVQQQSLLHSRNASMTELPSNRALTQGSPFMQSSAHLPVSNAPYTDNPFATPNPSQSHLGDAAYGQSADHLGSYGAAGGKPAWAGVNAARDKQKAKSKKRTMLFIIIGVVALIVIVVVILALTVFKKKDNNAQASGTSGASNGKPGTNNAAVVIGKSGDSVKMEDGTSFTYKNDHGGIFIVDDTNPYNYDAQAQSWTPPLNETWPFGKQRIFGVNLGGWLVPEPFIVPHLYEKYSDLQPPLNGDEWTLSQAMTADTTGGGLSQMENHYKTFITEQDFAEIAGAGLNWVRLPIPFNAFGTLEGEPFLPDVAWTYVLKAFKWARKYGIRINLDFHTMPGSHNGLNHSGKRGFVAWMNSVMGLANAQRSLDFIRGVTEFISQDEYKNLVPIIGVVNEPQGQDWDTKPVAMHMFYLHVYKMIREITGIGEGKGPYVAIHDHFQTMKDWEGFLSGADRLALDSHMYFTFGGKDTPSIEGFPAAPCGSWGTQFNQSRNNFGFTFGGEWSLGLMIVASMFGTWISSPTQAKNCTIWNDYTTWTPEIKQQLKDFALSHMDAFGDFFFWTWKTTVSKYSPGGTLIGAPLWNYKLGLDNGWMPTDPRDSINHCATKMNVNNDPNSFYRGELLPWQTGGTGAGTLQPTATASIDVWPPPALATISNLPAPQYTATGPPPKLPTPTWAAGVTGDDGWANDADTSPGTVPIANCKYPDPWNPGNSPPNPLCQ
ncbi:glycoside hydrolase [Auriculariales sp. MPI-PUGE-AT-0066]|nr:glycoside hydrolase [Auriculariales sp. MPI-PUGE-AT-0066]